MAGIKGKSGGLREGAGRKEKPKKTIKLKKAVKDPKNFLVDVMNNAGLEDRLRIDAAKTLMPYIYLKLGEGGMKKNKNTAADKAITGKFAPSAPPKPKVMHF